MKEIYFGGSILTMENIQDNPEAILVENGSITYVGTLLGAEQKAGGTAHKIDLKGKCLMPAFIDSHSHFVLTGQMTLFADLDRCQCFDDIVREMNIYIKKNKITSKQVAVGFGYDHNFLREEKHPSKDVLNRVSCDIPILIIHKSGHLGCCNSAMLSVMQVNEKTRDPKGGKYGRYEGSNEINGYLEEAALMKAQAILGNRLKVDIFKMLNGMQQSYIENGITTAQEGAGNKQYLFLLKLADFLNILKLDVVIYPLIEDEVEKIIDKNKKIIGKYKRHLKIGGCKMILDGSPQGRSAWMSEEYLGGECGYRGYPWLTNDEVEEKIRFCLERKLQLLTHCNGDAASEQLLDMYEKVLLDYDGAENLRPVMIHCQTVRNDQLDRMKRLKMIASIFVGHVYYWGDVHLKNFGEKRGNRISPVKDAIDRDIIVNFHQDTPITSPNMLHSIWCAVNRKSRKENIIGDAQKIDVYTALKAVTINAAYQYFEENSKGSIRVGKFADLIILSENPLEVSPMKIKDIFVLETIKKGKHIYKRKKNEC